MSDHPTSPTEGMEPTAADAVTAPAMAPMDDDAGGPTADKSDTMDQGEQEEPGDAEAAAQLGGMA